MKLIVGLGNPGRKYEDTRHNIGFGVINQIISEVPVSPHAFKRLLALVYFSHSRNVAFAKPTVFMNESGKAVEKILRYYDMKILRNLWIIHDDIDLPLGRIKIQVGGGVAGHRGVESIIKEVKSYDFVRFRLGIGRPRKRLEIGSEKLDVRSEIIEKFVLSKFRQEEKPVVEEMVERAVEAIKFGLKEGIEKTLLRKF